MPTAGSAAPPTCGVHHVISADEALAADAEAAKAVTLKRVHARLEDEQLGPVLCDEAGQPVRQQAEVLLAWCEVWDGTSGAGEDSRWTGGEARGGAKDE
eukprot:113648-Chlamydomonas_euryale.AAC.6